MAPFVPVRGYRRGNNKSVRIGKKSISSEATTYVDLGSGTERRDLARFSAIGALYPVGSITSTDSEVVVIEGGEVTAQGAPDQTVDISAGELRDRSTGEYLSFAASDNEAADAADADDPRVDIVQIDVTDGTISYKAGTAAADPVAPDADADNVVLAEIDRAANDNTIADADITDVRPRP